MCGIAGLLGRGTLTLDVLRQVKDMGTSMAKRGPDEEGLWRDAESGVCLVHRRLSVMDLSPAGSQPMVSHCQRYVIVFNGEIYNTKHLLRFFPEARFRGHSDTEVLLELVAKLGLSAALSEIRGMFAFALWDRSQGVLSLARDRFGEKPLYFGWAQSDFVFASELKAFRCLNAFNPAISSQALGQYLELGYVPAPMSIYQDVWKLPPGHYLSLTRNELVRESFLSPRCYWSAAESAVKLTQDRQPNDVVATTDLLESTLLSAVESQMQSDVPLGAFLSGGVDSSTIVALMQRVGEERGANPTQTFSIGFDNEGYNEANYARAVAAHLGTRHHELNVSEDDALAVIPELATIYDEPFADSSQIPMVLVSRLARQHVTVALSGDGGDELFGGYNRHVFAHTRWPSLAKIPSAIRHGAGRVLATPSPKTWDQVYGYLKPLISQRFQFTLPGEKLHKFSDVLACENDREVYERLVRQWRAAQFLRNPDEGKLDSAEYWAAFPEFAESMMLADICTYLPDDILVKVDRAAMHASLETRVPFLDSTVFDLAWRAPLDLKIRNGQGKWLLRQVLYRHVPPAMVDRPKAGFAVPLASWLRGKLRPWAESLLDERRLMNEGVFNAGVVKQCWEEHLSGRRDWHHALWNVLMFQAWSENWA